MAALLLQSLVRLQDVPLGFEPHGVATARLSASPATSSDVATLQAFQERLVQSLEALPSVRFAGLMTSAPFGPGVRRGARLRDRAAPASSSEAPTPAIEQVVSAGVFRALGLKLLAGREFNASDQAGSPRVAIVSGRLARRLWPASNPIGQIVEFDGRSHEVVGVVDDIRGNDSVGTRGGGLDREPAAVVYLSSAQFPQNTVSLVIRTDVPLRAILPAVRAAIREVEPAQPLPELRSLDDWIAESAAAPRLTTTLASAFAVAALILTMVGIYGVISYSVTQRTQEIGVRMAIGAARSSVVGLVLRTGMTWAGGGVVLGLLGAWAASRTVASLLFDISAADPLTFASTAVALVGVAGLACAIPAVRATRIDPVIALRGD
jgi:predicted permease